MACGLVYTILVACGQIGCVGQNRKNDAEYDQDCIEEDFQLARVQFVRDGAGDWEL